MQIVIDNEGEPSGRCAGAGVLAFCSPDPAGEVYFVLGKERDCPDWRYGSNRWSDFAGAGKDGEAPEVTAAREFVEETLAVVPWGGEGDATSVGAALALEGGLSSERYALKVVVTIHSSDHPPKNHVTYVCRIPWCPEAPVAFERTRSQLRELQAACERRHGALCRAVERAAAEVGGSEVDGSEVRPPSPRCVPLSATYSPQGGVLEVTACGWCGRAGGGAEQQDATTLAMRGVSAPTAAEALAAVDGWRHTVSEWEADEVLRGHPAVRVARDSRSGAVCALSVSADFLEKQSIQLWSRSRLEDVVRNNGHFRGESFRPCFLPTMATVLDAFSSAHEGGGGADARSESSASPFVEFLSTQRRAASAYCASASRASRRHDGSHPNRGERRCEWSTF